jgi:hypothetical protein
MAGDGRNISDFNLTDVSGNDANLTNITLTDLNLTNISLADLNLTNISLADLNLTEFDVLPDNFFPRNDYVAPPFNNTYAITSLHLDTLRGNNTNNISGMLIWTGEVAEQNDSVAELQHSYIVGVCVSPVLVLGLGVLWALVIIVLRLLGYKFDRLGCAAGKAFEYDLPPESMEGKEIKPVLNASFGLRPSISRNMPDVVEALRQNQHDRRRWATNRQDGSSSSVNTVNGTHADNASPENFASPSTCPDYQEQEEQQEQEQLPQTTEQAKELARQDIGNQEETGDSFATDNEVQEHRDASDVHHYPEKGKNSAEGRAPEIVAEEEIYFSATSKKTNDSNNSVSDGRGDDAHADIAREPSTNTNIEQGVDAMFEETYENLDEEAPPSLSYNGRLSLGTKVRALADELYWRSSVARAQKRMQRTRAAFFYAGANAVVVCILFLSFAVRYISSSVKDIQRALSVSF